MPSEHTFQYIVSPEGVVHIRVAHSSFTLCAILPTDEWQATTQRTGPLCNHCFSEVESFVVTVITNGKKTP